MDDNYRLKEWQERTEQALGMGGVEKIGRLHQNGRLTARERIHTLLDRDTFEEMGLLAHSDLPAAADKTPADGKVTGFGLVNGRSIFVSADDVTVMAGAGGRVGVGKQFQWASYAAEKGYPCVHLGDAGGARVPDIMGSAGMMSMVYPIQNPPRDRRVPLITTIMGECYGGPSWTAAVSDIIIQVKGAIMAVGGPSILSVATGEVAAPEELGGWELHAHHTGQVDLFAENEEECLWLVRQVLGYLPENAQEPPPSVKAREAVKGDVLTAVPADPKRAYDMHQLIHLIVDADSLLELKPFFAPELITAFARLNGHVVGLVANNPQHNAGAMGPGACDKASSFIVLCDSFHIPLLFWHDTPGFLIGKTAEHASMPRKIMTWIEALHQCTVPRVSLVVRKSYGMAHCNMSGGNMGSDALLAWPSADVSFVAPEVAVSIVYGRKLAQLDDPQAAYEQYLDELNRANAPWAAAGLNLIDRVIDPQQTRQELINALHRARGPHGLGQRSQRRLANWPRLL
ncbi:MAG: carboxyl transferase [Ardenticatenaceae bacterium]|nr:carboxyl transferase [Ardenticatenaceae bacterium]